MKKKDIRKLAEQSYKELNENKVERIASLLSRKDLKEYVRQLKLLERANQVIIDLPNLKSYNKNDNNFFENLFKGKRILYQEDSTLLLGARVTDNDMVYDLSLKSRLEETGRRIETDYE